MAAELRKGPKTASAAPRHDGPARPSTQRRPSRQPAAPGADWAPHGPARPRCEAAVAPAVASERSGAVTDGPGFPPSDTLYLATSKHRRTSKTSPASFRSYLQLLTPRLS
ncbi:stannin isoform X1 [Coturnix japonica]|uniref:stannin isoform X1 n=1 Tax=Coturnix japonica TaxID=93934 RepID=UPI0013A5DF8D|nr:stannin isoform X1 [Coturnix japonica]